MFPVECSPSHIPPYIMALLSIHARTEPRVRVNYQFYPSIQDVHRVSWVRVIVFSCSSHCILIQSDKKDRANTYWTYPEQTEQPKNNSTKYHWIFNMRNNRMCVVVCRWWIGLCAFSLIHSLTLDLAPSESFVFRLKMYHTEKCAYRFSHRLTEKLKIDLIRSRWSGSHCC